MFNRLSDDLNSNPLFSAFLSSSHYATAAADHLLIAVPHSASLTLINKITKDVLETHILRRSPYYQDQLLTLNGKSVICSNTSIGKGGGDISNSNGNNSRTLECKAGFSGPRTVSVTGEELYYDDDYNSFPVLRVNLPLEGKVPAEYYKTITEGETNENRSAERRTPAEAEATIIRLTSDATTATSTAANAATTNIIMQNINKFIHQFNTSYVLVKGFIQHAGAKVTDACSRLREEALPLIKRYHKDLLLRGGCVAELQYSIECLVMSGIHKKLFSGLTELYTKEEETIQALCMRYRSLSMHDLGIRADIVCQPTVAINLMSRLGEAQTPMLKMIALEDISKALTQAVKQAGIRQEDTSATPNSTIVGGTSTPTGSGAVHMNGNGSIDTTDEPSSSARDTVLSAEDMIPLTLYVLLQSGLPSIHAHLQYFQHFQPNSTVASLDHLKVHLANFQAAIQMIQAGKLGKKQKQRSKQRKKKQGGKQTLNSANNQRNRRNDEEDEDERDNREEEEEEEEEEDGEDEEEAEEENDEDGDDEEEDNGRGSVRPGQYDVTVSDASATNSIPSAFSSLTISQPSSRSPERGQQHRHSRSLSSSSSASSISSLRKPQSNSPLPRPGSLWSEEDLISLSHNTKQQPPSQQSDSSSKNSLRSTSPNYSTSELHSPGRNTYSASQSSNRNGNTDHYSTTSNNTNNRGNNFNDDSASLSYEAETDSVGTAGKQRSGRSRHALANQKRRTTPNPSTTSTPATSTTNSVAPPSSSSNAPPSRFVSSIGSASSFYNRQANTAPKSVKLENEVSTSLLQNSFYSLASSSPAASASVSSSRSPPVQQEGEQDPENNGLGDFLSRLKKSEDVVTGSFRSTSKRK